MDDDTVHIVERAGLVVLGQDELVITAAGSEAVLARIRDDGLVLEFPVEVEVRIVPACDPDEHVDTTLARLTAALESLA
jgi:hypothetical protein